MPISQNPILPRIGRCLTPRPSIDRYSLGLATERLAQIERFSIYCANPNKVASMSRLIDSGERWDGSGNPNTRQGLQHGGPINVNIRDENFPPSENAISIVAIDA